MSAVTICCKICENDFQAENFRSKMCPTCSRQKRLDRCKSYKQKHKEAVTEYNKVYKEEHKEEVDEYNRIYNLEHREEIQQRQTKQHQERRKNDPRFKLSKQIRHNFYKFIIGHISNNKQKEMEKLVGCTRSHIISWLEYNFTEDMSWQNYGEVWHIDHILLCSMFDLLVEEECTLCFAWENTRPLYALLNLKRKKFTDRDLLFQEIRMHYFKKHVDNHYQRDYFGTKLVRKLASGLS